MILIRSDFLFIAAITYQTCSGYKKTLSYAHDKESVVNEWLEHKLNQLSRLKCTNVVAAYSIA